LRDFGKHLPASQLSLLYHDAKFAALIEDNSKAIYTLEGIAAQFGSFCLTKSA